MPQPVAEPQPSSQRRHAPACLRNREPILAVLRRVLPSQGLVLEIASGTGEHAAYFAPLLAPRRWQPSDADADARASIAAHAADAACPTLLAPIALDAASDGQGGDGQGGDGQGGDGQGGDGQGGDGQGGDDWPIATADAIVCINMIHIAPWRAAVGLMAGAERLLSNGGVLYLYGPFMRAGHHTAPSNEAFDRSLRQRDPAWGVRDLNEVTRLARRHGLVREEVVEMPANNLSAVFRRI
jgi:SAM-dependent methyltransferase